MTRDELFAERDEAVDELVNALHELTWRVAPKDDPMIPVADELNRKLEH